MRGLILCAALGAAALAGCYTTGEIGYSGTYASAPSGEVYATTPDLVTVSPGVQVVADYDEPVFFSDGFYWRYADGYWYRSANYYSGWYYYERPPVAVMRIDRPYAYVHYRPNGYVARRTVRYRPPERIVTRDHRSAPVYQAPARSYSSPAVVRDHRAPAPAPVVRDHREPAPAARAPAPAPAPVVRDHREPVRDTRDVRDHRR